MNKLFKISLIFLSIVIIIILLFFSIYTLVNSRTFQLFGEIIPRVETSEKVVALTFDDGPTEYAPEILAVLKEKQVKATFYVIGQGIEEYQNMAKMIVQEGHELGNHSYSHQRMVFKSPSFIRDEVDKTDQLIRAVGFEGEINFRPPYSKKLFYLPYYLSQNNRKTIMIDVEPETYISPQAPPEDIVNYITNNTKPGSIILLHPWYGEKNNSREAIGAVIDSLKAKGFEFVTVGELLEKTR